MKKVKDSQKRWKQLVTMLLVAALLVTGTPDVVGFASEGTQEQVTAAAEQSQKTQEKAQKESAQEETAQKEAVQDHEQMSEEAGGQQSSSSHSDTAVKEENTEKERSAAGTTERSETEEPQNNKQKNEVVSGAKSVAPSTSKVREPDKNEEKKEEKEEFIHVLIKFYAVLEECMPVEENLRKRFRNQMISINLLKLPSSQGIVGEKSFVASR